jgi:hypothetical protein
MKGHLFATDEPAKDFGNENAHSYCADGSTVATGEIQATQNPFFFLSPESTLVC